MVPARPLMEPTAAPTLRLAITPQQAPTRAVLRPRPRMALKRWDRPTTHTPEPMAQLIKVPMLIRTGEARQPRRMARRSTRNITPTLTEPSEQPRARMVTSMPPRTATPTRTQGVAGRKRVPLLMLHTVGEAAVDRTITAAARHRGSGGFGSHSGGDSGWGSRSSSAQGWGSRGGGGGWGGRGGGGWGGRR